ncbi:MAG: flippase-like domain-containing protein [Lewinellaceae bacterium]|nr:flippase-like domain-containing protein [Lewinellaceae bacterium]
MEKSSANVAQLLPARKTVVRGIQAFVLLSLLGTLLSMWWKRPEGLASVLSALEWRFALLLVPLIGLDYWLGGMRYRLFLNGRGFPDVSLWQCMRSNWANMFMGAATPFQTGGGLPRCTSCGAAGYAWPTAC